MTRTTSPARTAAPVSTTPAAPAIPTGDAALIELHASIHNGLSLAAWHIARGNSAAAGRKVRQALAALRQLDRVEA